jgi:hypothetical protein
MLATCETVTGTYDVPVPDIPGMFRQVSRRETCRDWAGLYYASVSGAGFVAFDSGQEEHCDCVC